MDIQALSPLDGRYSDIVEGLRGIFSEYALIRYRYQVEMAWFLFLCDTLDVPVLKAVTPEDKAYLQQLSSAFDLDDAHAVKEIEATTRHDVKALEYFMKSQFAMRTTLKNAQEFIHFACTSEDINNISYAHMTRDGRAFLISHYEAIAHTLNHFAKNWAKQPMLSRTHGQSASPTTVGKECANIAYRLTKGIERLRLVPVTAKINGAVGNYNAHSVAFPELNWPIVGKEFIESLGFEHHPFTTQIEPHDNLCQMLDAIAALNVILMDCSRDMWGYISLNYFKQKPVEGEVGSSTMPHKVNPIDFENAEGNVGLANALARFMSDKLPISRFQRDLSDSTVLRNLGVVFGHSLLGLVALLRGLNKLDLNKAVIDADLSAHPEVLTEAIQTVMRLHGLEAPYEQLKALSRGKALTLASLRAFIAEQDLPENDKARLMALTPHDYIGYAV
ncbi:MAG: adenylosuccinate lyase [Gammaproteobacteria bacterium]